MKTTLFTTFLLLNFFASAQLNLQMESSDAHYRSRDNPADAEYFRQKWIDKIRSINVAKLVPQYIQEKDSQVILLLTSETCGACPLMKIVMDSLQNRNPNLTLLEFTPNEVKDSSFFTKNRFIGSNPSLYDTLQGYSFPAVYFIKNGFVVDKSPRGGVIDRNKIVAKVEELEVYIRKYF